MLVLDTHVVNVVVGQNEKIPPWLNVTTPRRQEAKRQLPFLDFLNIIFSVILDILLLVNVSFIQVGTSSCQAWSLSPT